MIGPLALFICLLFILWLFIRDQKLRPITSWGLWVAVLWIMIIGSRPVSSWFGGGTETLSPYDYLEGSPLDRNIFLFLIIVGAVVLLRRRPDWGKIFDSNRWFFAFLIYCGITIIWSDYPLVSFRGWIKVLGSLLMVLIILTEKEPVMAIRAVFARYAYVVIPLSATFILFSPEIGTYYENWSGEISYIGVALGKNTLGLIVFICGLFLVWDLMQMRSVHGRRTDKTDLLNRGLLLTMVAWLIYMARSSTSLVCLLLGVCILLFVQIPFARRQIKYLGTYSLLLVAIIILLYSIPGILETFVKVVGRDTSLTGRTELWADLLKEPINPFLGTGYHSFWVGPHADYLWSTYAFHPNQAHNGYLETYLDGGLVGVCLLMGMIVSTGNKLRKELLLGSSFGTLLFTFLVVAVLYNWTEAMFCGLNLVWIVLSIAALHFPPSPEFESEGMV